MKYCLFTYIFGKNKELFREPKFIDKDIEYICVTDQYDLKSNVWKIIYEPLENVKSLRDKTALTKFNPFKYTTAEKIIIQDMSLECITSLSDLYNMLDENFICLKKHPQRNNLAEELPQWKVRGLLDSQIQAFYKIAQKDNIQLTSVPLYECCVMCIHNDEITKMIFDSLLELMSLLGVNGNMIVTQQCPFAYLLATYYNDLKIGYINQNKYFTRYIHNTNDVNKL